MQSLFFFFSFILCQYSGGHANVPPVFRLARKRKLDDTAEVRCFFAQVVCVWKPTFLLSLFFSNITQIVEPQNVIPQAMTTVYLMSQLLLF